MYIVVQCTMYNVIVHTAVSFLTTVILPKYILYLNSSQSRRDLEIEKIIIHEEYCVGKAFAHDIALLKLKEKVDVSMFPPACLPPRDADYTGKPGSVYGWGREIETPAPPPCDNPRPPISPVLRETTQTIVSNEECKRGFGVAPCCLFGISTECPVAMKIFFSDDMICGFKSGTGFCQGDSGGGCICVFMYLCICVFVFVRDCDCDWL